MTAYVSILSCLAKDGESESTKGKDVSENGVEEKDNDELTESDKKEVDEFVEDLMTIQSKDMLKKNLYNMVTENITLKKQIKQLKTDLAAKKEATSQAFQIDCDGLEDVEAGVTLTFGGVSAEVMGKETPVTPTEKAPSGSNRCFNCGESGCRLSDCKLPRDARRIAKNRRDFQNSSVASSARYHEDELQKFGHLSPGLPSSKLSEALGLRSDELPRHIYRMRELGYPPGWLSHAQINQSGITLYHDRGKVLKAEEDGEVVEVQDKLVYDTSRLVEWPGFNSEVPRDFRDDTERMRVRRRSGVESITRMRERLGVKEQKGYVRGEMMDTSTTKMDTEEEEGERPPGEEAETPPGDEDVPPGEDRPPGEKEEDETPVTPIKPSLKSLGSGNVTQTDPGTPICEKFSPFGKLPKYDNFGKDMTEHIAFENLPNATGNWDKMRGVLKGVRGKKTE